MGQGASCSQCAQSCPNGGLWKDEIVEIETEAKDGNRYASYAEHNRANPPFGGGALPAYPDSDEDARQSPPCGPSDAVVPNGDDRYGYSSGGQMSTHYSLDSPDPTEEELRIMGRHTEQEATDGDDAKPSPVTPPAEPATAASGTFSFDDVLSDIERCEKTFYASVFISFDDDNNGKVPCDHMLLCESLKHYTALTDDTVASAINKQVGRKKFIEEGDFLQLIRNNAVNRDFAVVIFDNMSNGDTTVASGDVSMGLQLYTNEQLSPTFTLEQWDQIAMSTLWNLHGDCTKQQWEGYLNEFVRKVRLFMAL